MSNLKEKFGKFELSKEQAKKVNGGRTWTCYNKFGVALGTRTSIDSAMNMCDAANANAKAGFGIGCEKCVENFCTIHEDF